MAFRVKVGDPGGQATFLHRAGVARAHCEIALPCSCVDALSFENHRSPPLPGSPREPHCTCRPSGAAPSQPSRLPKRCWQSCHGDSRHTHLIASRLCAAVCGWPLSRGRLPSCAGGCGSVTTCRSPRSAPSLAHALVAARPPESPRGPLLWCTAAAPRWRPKSANRIFLGNVTLTPCKAGTPPLEDRFVLRSRLSHTTFVMRRG